jgi:hypothetical protein
MRLRKAKQQHRETAAAAAAAIRLPYMAEIYIRQH